MLLDVAVVVGELVAVGVVVAVVAAVEDVGAAVVVVGPIVVELELPRVVEDAPGRSVVVVAAEVDVLAAVPEIVVVGEREELLVELPGFRLGEVVEDAPLPGVPERDPGPTGL